jgi:hypothetical protein
MKKIVFPLILLWTAAACSAHVKCDPSNAADCLKVLFIGNSYTYENDLPTVLSMLAKSGGHALETGLLAAGGRTLMDHLHDPQTLERIQGDDWTYVVLQEQSEIPAVESSRTASMYPAVRELAAMIRRNRAVPLLLETWGHRDGAEEFGIADYPTMQNDLAVGYGTIARELNLAVIPVGSAWQAARERHPEIELWQSDGSHPNRNGTYLAACVLYAVLYRQSPAGLSYTFQIPPQTAGLLQEAARETVFGG